MQTTLNKTFFTYRSFSTTKKKTRKILTNLRTSRRINDYRPSDIRAASAGTVQIIKSFGVLWSVANNHILKKTQKNKKLNKFENSLAKVLERTKTKNLEAYSRLGESLLFNKDVHRKTPRNFADRVFADYEQKPRKVENSGFNIGLIQKLAKAAFVRQQGLQSRSEKDVNRA